MSIGSRLKTIRNDFKLNQKEFAEKLQIHIRSVQNYEREAHPISQDVLIKLMNLGYSIPWLLTGEGSMKSDDYVLKESFPVETDGVIPVLGIASAGPDGFYDENNVPVLNYAEEFVPRPKDIKDPMAYALRISVLNGDSMMPYFKPEEIVIASPMATVVDNDKVIAKLRDGRVMFKLIRFRNHQVELHSANPDYETIKIPNIDLLFAHKVVGSWGK